MAEREAWLRGPVEGVPPLLQPVAHALIQAHDEVVQFVDMLPPSALWSRPGGLASPGFHLRHLAGVLDRLLTYARGESLTDAQLAYLAQESIAPSDASDATQTQALVAAFGSRVDAALAQLRDTPEHDLTAPRDVGRARAPSTVIGLLVHAAEHTMRHTGQLLVTVRWLVLEEREG